MEKYDEREEEEKKKRNRGNEERFWTLGDENQLGKEQLFESGEEGRKKEQGREDGKSTKGERNHCLVMCCERVGVIQRIHTSR
ncbi:hypothetical protein ASPWEDRAFT_39463 [Aspergillus wentii DTO 134E9]|uniref:Uncharacterized protein n=1 Tax=Aspergillus wentii DTO 134E9 TaxID=1073089 RepID=A0A1L9RSB7_ASPWE|nr:uncharacterized protein ASPWEDRAFT_39463 [Aspergillus wentii DTO 134E9]OJJ37727.1 hypothetical protein ASPWEDRAFT_39463 [Aspergillus wentii DTO 134E9]